MAKEEEFTQEELDDMVLKALQPAETPSLGGGNLNLRDRIKAFMAERGEARPNE